MGPDKNGRNGWVQKLVLPIFIAMLLGMGGLAIRTAFTHGERITKVESRQDGVDSKVREMADHLGTIYQWVLKQQGSQEARERWRNRRDIGP